MQSNQNPQPIDQTRQYKQAKRIDAGNKGIVILIFASAIAAVALFVMLIQR